MPDKHYVGEIGTEVIINCGTNISAASTKNLKVLKPDGKTEVVWAAEFSGTNSLKYIIKEGDLDQVGSYSIQPYIILNGWIGHGETVRFVVNALWN